MQHAASSKFVVAITGGIASGKSEISRRFEHLGITVADADAFARALVEPGQPALDEIVERFGNAVLYADGHLDRATLRRRVFDDDLARRDLEAILHPRIRIGMHAACLAATSAYAMAAIPLLAEVGGRTAYPWLARILVVDAPRTLQLQRLLRRDGTTLDQAERMLAAQATREERLALADDVIDNSGSFEDLKPQVAALHQRYLELAALQE
ncbi:MAG: dephospho-CoA kinase [Lysobacteraceae bacterium]